ncbi:MAG: two-component sensor histidine kinase, partial [Magnetovibrio sp.]|nr:two-component sensor histidine kinase [Magnetovibrio sp.]
MSETPTPAEEAPAPPDLWQKIRRASGSRKMAYALSAAAFLSGMATVATITGRADAAYELDTVLALLYIDGILMLLLAVVVARRLVQVWMERRRGAAGAGLHGRLVVTFSLVAVAPAIMVAIFSALFLNFGMESWFSERVRTGLQES